MTICNPHNPIKVDENRDEDFRVRRAVLEDPSQVRSDGDGRDITRMEG